MLNLFLPMVVAAIAFAGGYWWGGDARENKIRAGLAVQQQEISDKAEAARDENQKTQAKAEQQLVSSTQSAQTKTTEIIKKIPVYVPAKDNSACSVPLGFVSLYDQATIAASGEPQKDTAPPVTGARSAKAADPLPVPAWIEQRSTMSLQDIERVHAHNMQAFAQLRGMYLALRTWANNSCYAP